MYCNSSRFIYKGWTGTFIKQVEERESKIDILVNNAGAAWGAPFEDYPDDGYDKVMNINVKAIFALTRDSYLFCSELLQQKIRVVSSILVPLMGQEYRQPIISHMVPAKRRSLFNQNLAVRMGPKGLNVNAIAPGPFESQMMDYMLKNFRAKIEAENPLGRIGNPTDMAGLALFLASEASKYMTGQIIAVDGGRSLGSASAGARPGL